MARLHLLLGATALVWAGAAAAQTASGSTPPVNSRPSSPVQSGTAAPAGAPTSAAGPQGTVSEVVVTADRRSTNLQTTAVAATVLSQDDLARNGVVTVDQLQFVAPSVTVNNFGQGNNFDIRGIGKGEHNTQTLTGVVTYRDGVAVFPGYIQEEPFFDVASVQLLRGPQGTFGGQNATGGALLVNTADPVINGGYSGYGMAHYGNYNDVGAQGAVNLPINDTLAARAALYVNHRDTFYDINGLRSGDPDQKWFAGRFSLLWKPIEPLSVLLKVDAGYLGNGGYFGDPLTTVVNGQTVANPTDHLFDINTNYGTKAIDRYVRTAFKVDYTLPDGITLRSVTGYEKGSTGWTGDIDGTALAAPNYIINESVTETQASQEFNIISPEHQFFSWVLGAYYGNNKYDFPTNHFDIAVPPGTIDERLEGVNDTHTWAGFGQGTLNFSHGVQLQVGLRYSNWYTRNTVRYYIPEFLAFGYDFRQRNAMETGDNVTGKVALNWDINRDNFVYAFIATGAKPGGLNTALYFSTPPGLIPPPFKQEYVTDYEVGWKAKFLDNHLRTQVGFYYNNFDHFQLIIPIPNNPLQSTEQNNPVATVLYGFEASAQAVFGDWKLNANLGLEHSDVGDVYLHDPLGPALPAGAVCNLQSGRVGVGCVNQSGHSQTYAPDVTGNFLVQYDIHLNNGDVISPSVNYSYISHQWGRIFENRNAGDYLAARNVLGASLAWTHKDYTVTLYGYNLNNDQYVSALLSPIRLAGAPRQFGVSLQHKF